jgi:hypothetical protein
VPSTKRFSLAFEGGLGKIASMDRAELEGLDRDALIRRAEKAGVSRPSILTRPELVDELLVRSAPRPDDPTLRKVRGFFGLARDLLASVIDRGLHLPDAAEKIRALRGPSAPPPARTSPNVLPTVTLAEIYATQGHRDRAVDTLRRVLEREPDHDAAQSLLDQLQDASYPVPAPPLPPEDEDDAGVPDRSDGKDAATPAPSPPAEPLGFLDDSPLPTKYDVDECVAIPVDPTTLFVYWEVRDTTFGYVTRKSAGGALVLRVLVVVPTWDGPRSSVRDFEVKGTLGDWFVRDLPAGTVVRAAIGWRTGDAFLPFAHSPPLETPPSEPCPALAEELVRWTPRGAVPVSTADADAGSIQRAVGRFGVQERRRAGAQGSSELMARPPPVPG